MNNLKPGRQLDSLIAKIMNFPFPGNGQCSCGGYCANHGTFPNYSTDMASAWEVVEKLRLQRTSFCIEQHHNAEEPTVWFINENNMKPGMVPVESMETCSATASTVPHAICLAALKAIANNED